MSKISKIGLQAYFDDELSESDNARVRDILLEDAKSTAYLEEILKVDRFYKIKEEAPSTKAEKIIKNNAYELLARRKKQEVKKRDGEGLARLVKRRIHGISLGRGFRFELVTLAGLLLVLVTLLRVPTIEGKMKAFSLDPLVVSVDREVRIMDMREEVLND